MWNYDFVIPDLAILVLFLIFFFIRKRLPVRLNKSFLNILIIEVITLFLDTLSSLVIEHSGRVSNFTISTIVIAFFMFYLFRAVTFYFFTYNVIYRQIYRNKFLYFASLAVFIFSVAIILVNFFHPLLFAFEKNIYRRQYCYNLIYVSSFYYIAASLCLVFAKRKSLSFREKLPLCAYNVILFSGYIFRITLSNYLLMDFFCLIAIIIIYMSFENPDLMTEEKSETFNSTAFLAVLEENRKRADLAVKALVIRRYPELREVYGSSQMDRGLSMIGSYLMKTFPGCLVFYLHNGVFALVNLSSKGIETNLCEKINQRFLDTWNAGKDADLLLETSFIHVSKNLKDIEADKILNAIMASLSTINSKDLTDYVITEETIASMQQDRDVKIAVERAVEQNSVELFLQPLVDVNSRKLVGAEALARIRDAEGKLIPPGIFIHVAEKNGRINTLGEQMFEKVCKFISENDVKAMGLSWINVNLSPIQFLRRDLNERFSAILSKYNVPANMIHLEITEDSMIDYVLLRKQILTMKKSGFQFVLDDYGSGYSNVTRLKKCPFINVKLDMEVVWDYFKEQDSILPSMVQGFKQMNFTVTAEGIESVEIADAMKSIGCDYLQGYYFDKPLPVDEFLNKYLKK